jgi:hypothetical protein
MQNRERGSLIFAKNAVDGKKPGRPGENSVIIYQVRRILSYNYIVDKG